LPCNPRCARKPGCRVGTGYDIKGGAAPLYVTGETELLGPCGAGVRRVGFMSKDELIIQLVKVALGILIAGYFLWWSLEVLKRLPPPH
jgi:hypothetical protein